MIVALSLNDNESPVWNLMWQMYMPCETVIVDAGMAWEKARDIFEDYARNHHDNQDILSAAAYLIFMDAMDEAKRKLLPYLNEWTIARHGYSLN